MFGIAALFAVVGSGSAFAADPSGDPTIDADKEPIVVGGDPVETIDDPIKVTLTPAEALPSEAPSDGPAVVVVPPVRPVEMRQETRADGSIWWCPPTTGDFQLRLPCRMISPRVDFTIPPVPTVEMGQETRADGSVWSCPPPTGRFQLRLPCQMISPPTAATVDAAANAGRRMLGPVRRISAAEATPDEPEDGLVLGSESADFDPDQVATPDADSALPATDTDPAFGHSQMDAGTAILLAVVLRAIAWGAQRREASSTR